VEAAGEGAERRLARDRKDLHDAKDICIRKGFSSQRVTTQVAGAASVSFDD
jgi:hypothetical protein